MEASTAAPGLLESLKEDLETDETKTDFMDASTDAGSNPSNVRTFKCEICDKILTTKQSLNLHKETHLDPEQRQTFRCEICQATFMSQPGLNYHHETKHTPGFERKLLPCPTCGRIFKSVEGRKIHMTIQHGAGGPIFKCKECPMVFARKPHLDLHMATHGSGLHVCTICGKSYARLKDLSRHEATCGVKELCCPVCGKQLRTEQAVENHGKKCRLNRCRLEPPGVGEKPGRSRKSDSGGEDRKIRVRRSKHDLFIGLEHLAIPSALIGEGKPTKIRLKPADPNPRRFACEHCPLKFVTLKAMQNHSQRRHWDALGLAEPVPDKRGRKRTAKLERVPKRKGRPRKIVNYVDPEELPEEVKFEARTEKVDVVELQVATLGEPTTDDPIEIVSIPEAIESNLIYVEAKREPVEEKDEPAPNILATNEDIRNEENEAGDDEFDYFENDPADGNDSLNEQMNADVPTLENNLSLEPLVSKELVIKLEKLDCSALVKSSSKRKRSPRWECGNCGRTFAHQSRLAQHRAREHASTETPTSTKPPLTSMLPEGYRCEECDESYQFEYKLRDHNEKVHGIAEAGEPSCVRFCEHCGKKLSCWNNLVKHLKVVHGETIDESQVVKCSSCRKKFLTKDQFIEHVCREREPIELKERSFKCNLCHRTYAFLPHLEAHYPVHPEYQNFKCDQCPKAYFKEDALDRHKRYMHASKPKNSRQLKSEHNNPPSRVECEHCGRTFAYQCQLALHRVKEHGSTETAVANRTAPSMTLPRNFHCDLCDGSFHLKANLATHKAKFHAVGEALPKEVAITRHTCMHCKQQFVDWGALIYHRIFIHGESIDKSQFVRCPTCRMKFVTDEELAEHICLNGIVRERERPYKCDLCDKAYSRRPDLEFHYCVHPEYHNVKCDECSKGFFNDRELNVHKKRIHKPTEAYVECSVCNQLFKDRTSLKRHKEIHSDREYCCEHCGENFKTSYRLQWHIKVAHTNRDEYLFTCTICGKTLKGKLSIKTHMAMHNNDRPFKCSFPSCDKTFITSTYLKTHEQSHTKDYKYKCKFCEFGTAVRKRILLHEQREHNHNRFANENDV